ncbi:MAG: sodium ion-translocating decarboxylase subunit beta, partial [Oscillospiraceae bacterium]|nr:sodium ion-translocating decarboxylase subunit beta [Oscillospiraceae bacterium]
MQAIINFCEQTGFFQFFQGDNWKCAVMIVVACVLLFLGIVKKFEPLLLVPIAIGMLVTNLPGAGMYHEILFAGGHIHWDLFGGAPITAEFLTEMAEVGVSADVLSAVSVGQSISIGLIDILYLGIKLGIYPCLIFMGVGAMTDFGPLIANPKSLLLGAAAQIGIFLTYVGCRLLGFTGAEAASVGIIGGADGPTAIFVTAMLAPALLGPIAVSAYSYMALVPVIQPPIMKALTTKKEREIVMKPLRPVTQREKIVFPIVVT